MTLSSKVHNRINLVQFEDVIYQIHREDIALNQTTTNTKETLHMQEI